MPDLFGLSDDLMDSPSHREEAETVDRMIFPLNVHESLQQAGGLKKGEKTGIIISFWLFGCGILGWLLMSWLQAILPRYYILITIIVEVVIQLTVGVYLLRFLLDERAMFREVDNADISFAQYFKIYKEHIAGQSTALPFDVLEFDDGSFGCFVQCRLGFNTNIRSDNTWHANHEVVQILNKAGLARKTIYHNEAFKSSQAAEDLREILGGIKDPNLFAAYREIVQNYLRIAEDESNVMCVTYLIYARTRIEKDDFTATINSVMQALTRDETVYRQVSILNYDEIVEFLRNYYRLDVLDMGLVRAHEALVKQKVQTSVKVLKVYGKSGKIYTNAEFKKLRSELLQEGGLSKLS